MSILQAAKLTLAAVWRLAKESSLNRPAFMTVRGVFSCFWGNGLAGGPAMKAPHIGSSTEATQRFARIFLTQSVLDSSGYPVRDVTITH